MVSTVFERLGVQIFFNYLFHFTQAFGFRSSIGKEAHGWSTSPASSTIPATWLQSSRGSSYRKEKSYDVLSPAAQGAAKRAFTRRSRREATFLLPRGLDVNGEGEDLILSLEWESTGRKEEA
ncbi:hypothetical protein LR48_Vigan2359s000100 [Vigna angularis]|nr:hypothetical protein LR48_Vigan2359s000100 [Vigna angularis]